MTLTSHRREVPVPRRVNKLHLFACLLDTLAAGDVDIDADAVNPAIDPQHI
jgi:hypothetical protein